QLLRFDRQLRHPGEQRRRHQHRRVALVGHAEPQVQVLIGPDAAFHGTAGALPRPFPFRRRVALESLAENTTRTRRREPPMTTAPRPETTLPTVDARIYPRGG